MSEIRATTISDLAGTGPATLTGQYAAKAWVNFDGTGTVAIRDSENVASLTDIGTGQYYVNYTNAMANTNYAYAGSTQWKGNMCPDVHATTYVYILTWEDSTGALSDRSLNSSSVFGDLA